MTSVLLTFPIEKQRLLDILEDDIEAIVSARLDTRWKLRVEALRRSRTHVGSMKKAIQSVTRASARVDAAHNTRDERPALTALIAAASGLRRAVEASEKGI